MNDLTIYDMSSLKVGDRFVISCDTSRFEEAIIRTIIALDKFTLTFQESWRPLSGAGRWAFRFCTWLGIPILDTLCWLETCPGAFADEFGDGWER